MFDIMFDIELNKIKKRYGNIVSFNIGQTCGFSFMNSDFVKDKTVVAVFIRGGLEFAVEMKLIGNEYKCNFPDELCDSAETYKLTVIAFTNDTEAPTDFRSTTAYYGTIEDSGCDGTKFAPKHTETVFESVGHILVSELRTSLETATGENHDNKTWEELNNTVAELPILKEEQTQALGDWDLIKDYFADYSGNNHSLFQSGVRKYRLPYIYTPKMQWTARATLLSPNLVEFGVDVSSATGIGGYAGFNTFANATGLERIVLTGNAMQPSLREFMRNNGNLVYLKMETPSVEVLEQTTDYYLHSFRNCSNLQTIDCELDFTGQTNFGEAFVPLYKLEYFRIKPFTLSTSLNLRFSQRLHISGSADYDSLISILNGITLDEEVAKNITLTFSGAITDITVGMYQFWMKNVYFRDGSYLYYSKIEEVEEGYAYLELTLYEAFINKGVTIAWV